MSRVVVCGSLNMDVIVESARRPHAGETVVTDTTSINIFKALHAALALRRQRRVILAERDSFPTDLYIAEGVAGAVRHDRA